MTDDRDDEDIKNELSASDGEGVDDVADVDSLPKKKLSGKKVFLFVILPAILILAGGTGLYMSGAMDVLLGAPEQEQAEHVKLAPTDEPEGPTIYYEVPDIIVNLTSDGRKQRFLKLSVTLELVGEQANADIEKAMPHVMDQFQTFLRELRVSDLEGSSGIYRIRQELLERVRIAAQPTYVKDVLFRDILIQ